MRLEFVLDDGRARHDALRARPADQRGAGADEGLGPTRRIVNHDGAAPIGSFFLSDIESSLAFGANVAQFIWRIQGENW